MNHSDYLVSVWESVEADVNKGDGYYHKRLENTSNSEILAGILLPGNLRRLSFRTIKSEANLQGIEEDSIGFTIRIGADPNKVRGKVWIHITATGRTYVQPFQVLCSDIFRAWLQATTEEESLSAARRRLSLWHRFFKRDGGKLGQDSFVGLFGELSLLERFLDAGIKPEKILSSWVGPLGKSQDFQFGDLAVEVKCATGLARNTVTISHERQLDDVGLDDLLLYHISFDFREGSGQTMADLVAGIYDKLSAPETSNVEIFEERLLAGGYAMGIPTRFDAHGFTERDKNLYKVVTGFPRIVESVLPSGVSNASYILDLGACSSYLADFSSLIDLIKRV